MTDAPFRSIRLRLTLWYVAILLVVLLAFSGAVYFTLSAWLNDTLTDSVSDRATATENLIEFDEAGYPSLNLSADETDPEFGETFQQLLEPSRKVIFDNSGQFGEVEIDVESFERALEYQRPDARSVKTINYDGKRARVVTQPVLRDGGIIAVLVVGESTEDVEETLNGLLLIIVIALPAALVLASFGGWWLASRALAPIDRITRTAADIGAHDLSRRLDLRLPDDEVGRLARTFDAMIARLDAAFQRQRQFTADASHELRTPLTAIRGQIDVALGQPRDAAEYQRVLAAVNEQVDRMTRLVGGLLMLARTDAGAMPMLREPVAVREMVESVAEQVRPLAAEKQLAVQISPGPDVTLPADQDLLLQLMLNLADNAVKYTDAGTITFGWRSTPDAVELVVADTGRGIPPEQRERVFERFHRVDEGRSSDAGGSGLGLAICRWIAEAHGGSIRIEDGAGGGTTVVVTLPRTA